MDSTGTTTAAWGSSVTDANGESETRGLEVRRRPADGSWSAGQIVDPDGGSAQAIEVDRAGNVTIAYQRASSSSRQPDPYAVTGDADGNYAAPVPLASEGRVVGDMDLAVSADGTATAAWLSRSATGTRVTVARRPSGGEWLPATHLSGAGTRPRGEVHVDAGGGGYVSVMWVSRRHTGTRGFLPARVRARTFHDGVWSPSATVSTSPDRTVGGVALSAGPLGTAIGVWEQRASDRGVAGGDTRMMARRRADGTWTEPRAIPAPKQGTTLGSGVSIARAAGRVMVVWKTWDMEVHRVFAMVRHGREGWKDPIQLTQPRDPEQIGGAVMVDGDARGRFRVLWSYERAPRFADRFHVKTRYRGIGGWWSDPVTLSPTRRGFGRVALALGPGWSAAAVWVRRAGAEGARVQHVGMGAS